MKSTSPTPTRLSVPPFWGAPLPGLRAWTPLLRLVVVDELFLFFPAVEPPQAAAVIASTARPVTATVIFTRGRPTALTPSVDMRLLQLRPETAPPSTGRRLGVSGGLMRWLTRSRVEPRHPSGPAARPVRWLRRGCGHPACARSPTHDGPQSWPRPRGGSRSPRCSGRRRAGLALPPRGRSAPPGEQPSPAAGRAAVRVRPLPPAAALRRRPLAGRRSTAACRGLGAASRGHRPRVRELPRRRNRVPPTTALRA